VVEARKFVVRVRKRYWRGSPDSVTRLRIGLECKAPRANLIADDWIESNILRNNSRAFLNIGEPQSIRERITFLRFCIIEGVNSYSRMGLR